MKIFTNKKIWQKIILLIILFFGVQFVTSTPVHAVDGNVLLEPVVNLFVSLSDSIMAILQDIMLQSGR